LLLAQARVKDYPQVSFRLPAEARDKLAALSKVRQQPQWRLVVESVECYLRDLPRHERAAHRASGVEQTVRQYLNQAGLEQLSHKPALRSCVGLNPLL
jgi:predicted DNA-binding protein